MLKPTDCLSGAWKPTNQQSSIDLMRSALVHVKRGIFPRRLESQGQTTQQDHAPTLWTRPDPEVPSERGGTPTRTDAKSAKERAALRSSGLRASICLPSHACFLAGPARATGKVSSGIVADSAAKVFPAKRIEGFIFWGFPRGIAPLKDKNLARG